MFAHTSHTPSKHRDLTKWLICIRRHRFKITWSMPCMEWRLNTNPLHIGYNNNLTLTNTPINSRSIQRLQGKPVNGKCTWESITRYLEIINYLRARMAMSNLNVRDQTQLIRYLLTLLSSTAEAVKGKVKKLTRKGWRNPCYSMIISCLVIKWKYYYLFFYLHTQHCFFNWMISFIWNVIQFLRLLKKIFLI